MPELYTSIDVHGGAMERHTSMENVMYDWEPALPSNSFSYVERNTEYVDSRW